MYASLAASFELPFLLFQASHFAFPFKSNIPGFAGIPMKEKTLEVIAKGEDFGVTKTRDNLRVSQSPIVACL